MTVYLNMLGTGYNAIGTGFNVAKKIHEICTRFGDEATLPLTNALIALKTLVSQPFDLRENDRRSLMEKTIETLRVIEHSTKPEEIFTQTSGKPEEQKQYAVEIQRECALLAELLENENWFSLSSPEPSVLKGQIKKVFQLLQREQLKQLGPIPKAGNYLINLVDDLYLKYVGSASQLPKTHHQHALIKLLSLLKKYKHTIHYPQDRTRDLYDAVCNLENSGALFKGVIQIFNKDLLTQDNDTIFREITKFLYQRIGLKQDKRLVSAEYSDKKIKKIWRFIKVEDETKLPKPILSNLNKMKIESNYKIHSLYLQIYALAHPKSKKSAAEVPERVRIQSALKTIESREGERPPGLERAITEVERLIENETNGMAKFEALWKAVAKEENRRQSLALLEDLKRKDNTKLTDLPKRLELLVSILELEEHGEEDNSRLLNEITTCADLAKSEMIKINQGRRDSIKLKFIPVLEYLENGDYLDATRLTQRIVDSSKLRNQMYVEGEADSMKSELELHIETILNYTVPPKNHKSAKLAIAVLREEHITPDSMERAIEKTRQNLVTNTCEMVTSDFCLKFLLHKNEDERKTSRRTLVLALDHVAGPNGDYEGEDLKARVLKAVLDIRGLPPEAVDDQAVKRVIEDAANRIMTALAEANTPKEKREAHLWELLTEIIEEGDIDAVTKKLSHGALVFIYKLLEFFLDPFTKSIKEFLRNHLILPSNGTLTSKNMITQILEQTGKGLSTYSKAKKKWKKIEDAQAIGNNVVHPDRTIIGKNEQEAIRTILNNPNYFGAYDRRELGNEAGYALIDKFLYVADFCNTTENWHDNINATADRPLDNLANDPFRTNLSNVWVLIKQILAVIPHSGVYLIQYSLKFLELLINFLAKQIAKFGIWQSGIVTKLLDSMADSFLKEKHNNPLIERILFERLQELEKLVSQDSQEEKGGNVSKEVSTETRRKIETFFSHLFEALELDSKDTSSEVDHHGKNDSLKELKVEIKTNLKKLLAKLLIVSSESFLNTEQMNDVLLKLLISANKGLRGDGEKIDPDHDNSQTIAQRKLQKGITEKLKSIIEIGVNPVISRSVDLILKGSSDRLKDFTGWMERRLFSNRGIEKNSERNIIHMLSDHLTGFMDKTAQDQEEVLRKIKKEYLTFFQEFFAKQQNMDGSTQHNSLKLNNFSRSELQPQLLELTRLLNVFFENSDDRETKIAAILAHLRMFEAGLIEKREKLNKIDRAEQSNIEGKQRGVDGLVHTLFEKAKSKARKELIPIIQDLVNKLILGKANAGRGLTQNRVLIRAVFDTLALGVLPKH